VERLAYDLFFVAVHHAVRGHAGSSRRNGTHGGSMARLGESVNAPGLIPGLGVRQPALPNRSLWIRLGS
jgi:hypothetical protein